MKQQNKRSNRKNTRKRFDREKAKQPNNYQDLEADDLEMKKFIAAKVRPKTNDPQWYFKDSKILNDVASFSFNKALGTHLDVTRSIGNKDVAACQILTSVPGVCALTLGPTAGIAVDASSPLNIAATNLYSYVRYKNSGSKNYDSPDLMLYMIAMDSIFACWNWMKRIYGYISTYSQLNRYMPKAYAFVDNVDFDEVSSNLANFRAWLNLKAAEISSFCVPATMTYLVRHSWLFSNIYMDSNTHKAQNYMFTPAYFYLYDETTSPNGGKLVPICINLGATRNATGNVKWTTSSLKALLDSMLNALQYSEDIGVMSGDILKAYGEGSLFKLSSFEPDYRVDPVYSQEVLTQFENAHIFTFNVSDLPNCYISQDPNTNYLKSQLVSTNNTNMISKSDYVNFHWDSPSPEDVVVATRLNVVAEWNGASTYTVNSTGSEICTNAFIVQFTEGTSYENPEKGGATPLNLTQFDLAFHATGTQADGTMTVAQVQRAMHMLIVGNMLESFDWHPKAYFGAYFKAGTKNTLFAIAWDFDNYTTIDNNGLEAINQMALLTEFDVPR